VFQFRIISVIEGSAWRKISGVFFEKKISAKISVLDYLSIVTEKISAKISVLDYLSIVSDSVTGEPCLHRAHKRVVTASVEDDLVWSDFK
jgi:hypothetical protein